MAFVTNRRLDRRTALKGIGVSVALPLLEAMVPARTAEARQMSRKLRFVAIEMVHGAAGSTAFGEKNNLWAPAEAGAAFDLSPSSLAPLEPYRKHLTIVSRTAVSARPRSIRSTLSVSFCRVETPLTLTITSCGRRPAFSASVPRSTRPTRGYPSAVGVGASSAPSPT